MKIEILSWNVNGVRAASRKGFGEWFKKESPDILCIQETKAHPDQLSEELKAPEGYHAFWSAAEHKKGYSGVATFTKEEPKKVKYGFGIKKFDCEGRIVITEFSDFILLNIYFPNGGQGPHRLKYKLEFYDAFLEYVDKLKQKGKNIIMCGDVNTAHNEIDLARPKENKDSTGFLPEERAWIDKFLSHGYADTFRKLHPKTVQYTYWDYKTRARERDVGWRLDYFIVNEKLLPKVKKSFTQQKVLGSDHCPIGIEIEI
jgi:exodeoxyribonuclease-3